MGNDRDYAIHSENEPQRLERQAELIGIERYLNHIPYSRGEHILDAACGSGSMTRLLAQSVQDGRLTGIDIRPDYLDFARKAAAREGLQSIEFTEASILNLPFAANSFDGCWASLVLHWLTASERVKAVQELFRVLRPGGWVVCTEPDGVADGFLSIEPSLGAEWSAVMHAVLEPNMGRKLYSLIEDAGAQDITIAIHPYWFRAIGSVAAEVLDIHDQLHKAALPAVIQVLGSTEKAEKHIERIRAELQRPDSVLYPLSFIVSGCKAH